MIPVQMSLQFSSFVVATVGVIFVSKVPGISKLDFNVNVFSAAKPKGSEKPVLWRT